MKKRKLFLIALAAHILAFSLSTAQALADPPHDEYLPLAQAYSFASPSLLLTDFSSLALQSQLAGFWNSVPRQPVSGFTSVMDVPWSITASGPSGDWQVWSAASYAWAGDKSGRSRVETGITYFSLGLDRSFWDAYLLGLGLDLGRYRQSVSGTGSPDLSGDALAAKIYGAARVPLDLELSGFGGLTSFFHDDWNYQTDGKLICWTAGLSLGRTFSLNPYAALRPFADYEFLLRSRELSGASLVVSFSQQRARLGLDFMGRIKRLIFSAGIFAEGRHTRQTGGDTGALSKKWQESYLGARAELNLLLGPQAELAIQYYGLFGQKQLAQQGSLVLRVFF